MHHNEEPKSRRTGRLTFIALAFVLAAYLWTFTSVGGFHASRTAAGYYQLLTDALVSGQLNLKVEPDPRLALLANPWDSYQGIPRLHDATYFHGHYYIYFGVAPVVLLMGPWRLITGTFLSEGAAGVVFAITGFLAGLAVLAHWLRLQARPLRDGWAALGVLVWGLASYALIVAQSTGFYSVPILCAFACLMAALLALLKATTAGCPGAAAWWMAASSAAWATGVASRPHYILSLPLLALPLGWFLQQNRGAWAKGRRVALIAGTVLPAALIGAALAWYNWARFGSVTEFGFRYQFTGGDQRFIKMWNPDLILPNLFSYTLQDAVYLIYYPFVTPDSSMVGILAWSPVAALAALFPLTLLSGRLRASAAWTCVGACSLFAGLIHLFALCILPIGVERYDVDFDPPLILCGLGVALVVLDAAPSWRKPWRRAAVALLACLAGVSVLKCSLLAMDRTLSDAFRHGAAAVLNRGVGSLQRLAGEPRGPLKFDATFDRLPARGRVPLVETGVGNDLLFAERVDDARVRFGFVHRGNEPLMGPPVPLDARSPHSLTLDMGSLYPPDTHPAFAGRNRELVDLLRRRVLLKLDGATVLSVHSNFYASDPFHVRIGWGVGGMAATRFPGSIRNVNRLPIPSDAEVEAAGWRGSVRLRFIFPPFAHTRSEPLVSTGSYEAADMVYVTYLGKGMARFGHDSNGAGSVETGPVTFDPSVEHTLEIGLGSLEAPAGEQPPSSPGLRLRFDGRWLLNAARPSHPSQPYQVAFGFNSGKLGSAEESFSGPALEPEHIDPLHATRSVLAGTGPVEASLQFVPMPSGISEPLIVSGSEGKGDIVFVRYLDSQRIQLGIDHWGIGMVLSPPIEVAWDKVYTVSVASAAFLPAPGDPAWGATSAADQSRQLARISVSVNGRVVVVGPWKGYSAGPDEIFVGMNAIGGSTCGPHFSGTVIASRRTPLAP